MIGNFSVKFRVVRVKSSGSTVRAAEATSGLRIASGLDGDEGGQNDHRAGQPGKRLDESPLGGERPAAP